MLRPAYPKAMAALFRRASSLLPLPLLAACNLDPVRFIPPTDRSLLEAQARLGEDGAGRQTGRITVAELLAKARAEAPGPQGPAARSGLVLRYTATEVQLDETQRRDLEAFAAAARGRCPRHRGEPAGGLWCRRCLIDRRTQGPRRCPVDPAGDRQCGISLRGGDPAARGRGPARRPAAFGPRAPVR